MAHDVDRRRKFKGCAKVWMNHHQIPRLDGDQAERCDGNLPFASRLMAVLSMTGHWARQALVRRNPIFRQWLKRWVLIYEDRKCSIFQWGLTDSLSAIPDSGIWRDAGIGTLAFAG
jgi:hypothetical protein